MESAIRLQDARENTALSLAAPVESGDRITVPPRSVRIRDGWLEWSADIPVMRETDDPRAEYPLGNYDRVGRGLLWQFVRLWSASDERILQFARENGVLWLDPDSRVGGSPPTVTYEEDRCFSSSMKPVPRGSGVFLADPEWHLVQWRRESLKHWRDWSLITYLALRFGIELRYASTRVDVERLLEEWRVPIPEQDADNRRYYRSDPTYLIGWLFGDLDENGPVVSKSLADQRLVLSGFLDMFAQMAQAELRVALVEIPRPLLRVALPESRLDAPSNPMPDIAYQLLRVVFGEERFNTCPECGELYPCARRRGRCPECAKRKRNESALRHYHENKERINSERRRERTFTPPS